MVDAELKDLFAKDVVMMKYIDIHPVVIHGGGPSDRQLPEETWQGL
ncbi:MAG TPA: hypothetical protein VFG29_05580 [Syntrophales bacterium]|nr:hypothetical protein [Syntrophales bacterium]